jgi:hypothetical protein
MTLLRRLGFPLVLALGFTTVSAAAPRGRPDPSTGYHQTDFPPEEFRARWSAIFDRIGGEAVAVAQGAPLANGFQFPRQSNTFARTMVETSGGVFSHTVGMAVHDVGGYRQAALRPGQVFAVDPQAPALTEAALEALRTSR